MQAPVVIIGIGQMGGVFARGFLSIGYPVFPVLRGKSLARVASEIPQPTLVLIAVAEPDLAGVLGQIPDHWKGRVALLQNELLPQDWHEHGIEDPTVITAWFEKKFRRPIKPLIASPIYGPQSELLAEALTKLKIPVETLKTIDELERALVLKNIYILTANIAGLMGADTVGVLLEEHLEPTRKVFEEVLHLQQALIGKTFNQDDMWQELVEIFKAVPGHGARGRSAPQRLERALAQAQSAGLVLDTLQAIHREYEG